MQIKQSELHNYSMEYLLGGEDSEGCRNFIETSGRILYEIARREVAKMKGGANNAKTNDRGRYRQING